MRRRANQQRPSEPPTWALDHDEWRTREGLPPRDVTDYDDPDLAAWRAATRAWGDGHGWCFLDLLRAQLHTRWARACARHRRLDADSTCLRCERTRVWRGRV